MMYLFPSWMKISRWAKADVPMVSTMQKGERLKVVMMRTPHQVAAMHRSCKTMKRRRRLADLRKWQQSMTMKLMSIP